MKITQDIENLLTELKSVEDLDKIQKLKTKIQNEISTLTKNILNLEKSERASYGKIINQVKIEFDAIMLAKQSFSGKCVDANDKFNYSIPVHCNTAGKLHPLTTVLYRIHNIFSNMNFQHISSKEIEDNFHNFDGLNIDEYHPARTEHDTFYVENQSRNISLRTQTSTAQIYVLKEFFRNRYENKNSEFSVLNENISILGDQSEIRVISSGKVYRSDHDSTHVPMFHQLEAMVVGESVTLTQLKWTLTKFCEEFFEFPNLKMRFRPNYFPFTEPSIEIDIAYRKVKNGIELISKNYDQEHHWMEVLGAGMINNAVFRKCGMKDTDSVQGFALGMGLDRLTMLHKNIPTLSYFYGKIDVRWLNDFGSFAQSI